MRINVINVGRRDVRALERPLHCLSRSDPRWLRLCDVKVIGGNTVTDDLGKNRRAALASKVEELARYRSEFFGKLREALAGQRDVQVVGDRFVFQSEVLFPSGSAQLQPAGEKQLVTIARAFLADPALLILDEATSSVDTRTELLVQQAMAALRSDRTSFVIAHRLSTIRDADVILVMEQGQIVEMGNHEILLAAGGAYARLYAAQFAQAMAPVD